MPTTPHPRPRGVHRPPVVDGGLTRRTLPAYLAHRIDLARRRAGLSMRAFARAAGISNGMAGYLCCGQRLPSREVAMSVIGALDLDAETEEELMEVAAVRTWDGKGRGR